MISKTNTYGWNAIAAWIALAISIITPTISLLLNNIHQRKLKKLELKHSLMIEQYNQMKSAIAKYHECVSTKLHVINPAGAKEYEIAYRELFLFVPESYWETLKEFNEALVSDKNSDSTQEQYLKVTEILASLLQEAQKQIPV